MSDALSLCGDYVLKTDKTLEAPQLWSLYMTLLKAEEGFCMLKGSLGLRPNFHQKEGRVDGHIFISVLAYHLLSWVRRKLEPLGDMRDWKADSGQVQGRLSFALAQGALLRRGDQPGLCFPDQQPQCSRADRAEDLSAAVAHRNILPMDQRALADQTLLWDEPQCGEDTNLDRGLRLPDGGHYSQGIETAGNFAQNFAAFECSPV